MSKFIQACIRNKILHHTNVNHIRSYNFKVNHKHTRKQMAEETVNSSNNDIPGEFSAILSNDSVEDQPDKRKVLPVHNTATEKDSQLAVSGTEKEATKRKKQVTAGHVNKKFKPKKKEREVEASTNELYNQTDYYFENGLRKVYPYEFEFTSYCKGRWLNRCILNVFSSEFRAYPEEEYEEKINKGVLTVNNKKVSCDYVLKNGDLIRNVVHRHETPVIAGKQLKIIHMCDDLLVVDKPCSWPVHPCGRYRYNTVVFVLAKEYNIKNLRTIHRLDRLTSGILMFGRTASKAHLIDQQIRDRIVSKEYLCRVDGNFPDEAILCKEPIEVISHKLGLCKVSPAGKDCETEFKKLSYSGKTSLVLCKPKTGRMHQIRVHLQYLGYPIANDPLYNNEVFGKDKGKLANYYKTDTELVQDYLKTYNAENWLGVQPIVSNNEQSKDPDPGDNSSIEAPESSVADGIKNSTFDPKKMTYEPTCFECKIRYRDPEMKDLVMYLHALRYKGPGWMYETSLPYWAEDGFIEDD